MFLAGLVHVHLLLIQEVLLVQVPSVQGCSIVAIATMTKHFLVMQDSCLRILGQVYPFFRNESFLLINSRLDLCGDDRFQVLDCALNGLRKLLMDDLGCH